MLAAVRVSPAPLGVTVEVVRLPVEDRLNVPAAVILTLPVIDIGPPVLRVKEVAVEAKVIVLPADKVSNPDDDPEVKAARVVVVLTPVPCVMLRWHQSV
jgi:hypothetical protein